MYKDIIKPSRKGFVVHDETYPTIVYPTAEKAQDAVDRFRGSRPKPTEPALIKEVRKPYSRVAKAQVQVNQSNKDAILDLMKDGWYSRSDIVSKLRMDTTAWIKTIKELLDSGLVIKEGEKKGTKYRKA